MVERAVPKNRGAEFLDLLEDLANDTCVAGEPECPRCELRKICPYVQIKKQAEGEASSRPSRSRVSKEKEAAPAPASSPAPAARKASARAAKEPTAPPPAPAKSPRGKHGTK